MLQKIISSLIGIFIFWNLSLSFENLPDGDKIFQKKSLLELGLNQYEADIWSIECGAHLHFLLDPIHIFTGLSASYTSLGKFEFVRSEDYAYQGIDSVSGNKQSINLTYAMLFGAVGAGITADIRRQNIGNINSYWEAQYTATCCLESEFGNLFGSLSTLDGLFLMECGYRSEFPIGKLFAGIQLSYQYFANNILKSGLVLNNYCRDLTLGLYYRFGIDYPVSDNLTIELRKRYQQWEWEIDFSPSLIHNNLFGAELVFYLPEPSDSDSIY